MERGNEAEVGIGNAPRTGNDPGPRAEIVDGLAVVIVDAGHGLVTAVNARDAVGAVAEITGDQGTDDTDLRLCVQILKFIQSFRHMISQLRFIRYFSRLVSARHSVKLISIIFTLY